MKKRNTPLFITGLFAVLIVLSFALVAFGGGTKKAGGTSAVGGAADGSDKISAKDVNGDSGEAGPDASGQPDTVTVVTSFYPMYIAAMNLLDGVEGVHLENLSEPQTGCLHDYQLVPSDVKLLTDADVFIINGGGMESFLGDVKGRLPDLFVLDTSETFSWNMPMLEAEEDHDHDADAADHGDDADADGYDHAADSVDHGDDADGHDHGTQEAGHHHEHEINAHFWLSVPLYRSQVEAMADGLCSYLSQLPEKDDGAAESASLSGDTILKEEASRQDVDDAAMKEKENSHRRAYGVTDTESMIEAIQRNRDAYLSRIDDLIAGQEPLREMLFETPVIVFHEGYLYIAGDYGMAVVGDMDLDEERQISAGEVAGIVDTVHACEADGKPPVILAEEQYGKEMAQAVAKETGVQVLYLDTIVRAEGADGRYEKDAYVKRMGDNMNLLKDIRSKR